MTKYNVGIYDKGEHGYAYNIVEIEVRFKDFTYMNIEQEEAFSLPSLFGSIGGQLGLLIGASVLSVVEVVDLLLSVCVKSCSFCPSVKPQRNRVTVLEMP